MPRDDVFIFENLREEFLLCNFLLLTFQTSNQDLSKTKTTARYAMLGKETSSLCCFTQLSYCTVHAESWYLKQDLGFCSEELLMRYLYFFHVDSDRSESDDSDGTVKSSQSSNKKSSVREFASKSSQTVSSKSSKSKSGMGRSRCFNPVKIGCQNTSHL